MEWLHKHRKQLLHIGGYITAAVVLDLSSRIFILQTGLAIFYPPAGLYLAAILLFGWQALPLVFLSPVFSLLVTWHSPDIPLLAILGIGITSLIAPSVTLIMLKKFSPAGKYLGATREVILFSSIALIAVTMESLIAAFARIMAGLGSLNTFAAISASWWVSNIIPCLTLTPAILLWYQNPPAHPSQQNRQTALRAALIGLCAPLTVYIALSVDRNRSMAHVYITLLPIMWGALAGGIASAIWSSLLIAATLLVLAPVSQLSPEAIQEAQFFLLIAALAALTVGAIVTDRKRAEYRLRKSEKRYRAIIDNAIDGVFQSTLGGHFLNVNPAMARMYGYESPQEMLGAVTDIARQLCVQPERRIALHQRLLTGEKVTNFEALNYRKDGAKFWASINIQAIYDETGSALYYDGTVEDVTYRKTAEEALRSSEERYRTLFNGILEGVYRSTPAGRFVDINPAMARMFGYASREELMRVDIKNDLFFSPEDRRSDYLAPGEERVDVFRMKRKDGSEIWVEDHGHYIYDEAGQIIFHEGLLRDVTPHIIAERERKEAAAKIQKLNNELNQRVKELETKNAELSQFTYTVSHDLKSPLVTINGFLNYLERDIASGNTDRVRQDMRRIQEATSRMHTLLIKLLELSRIGRIMNAPEVLSFADIAQEASDLAHGRLEAINATLIIQPNLPAVYGDRQRLTEVLQNLIDNAAKYMGSQFNPRIEIGQCGEEHEKSIFFVKDNGIGIEAQHQERIFDLFNKLDPKSEGTGIGLALVKKIIEVHGGRIWVESEPGKSSTFYFTLPSQ